MKIGLKNVFSVVALFLLVAAFAMSLLKYKYVYSYPVASLVLLGLMVVYIVIFVGIFTEPVETKLVQFWDILGFGGCIGLGLSWIILYKNLGDQGTFPFLAGLLSFVASIFLLLDAIFCQK